MQLLFSFYKIAQDRRVEKTLMKILPSQLSSALNLNWLGFENEDLAS
jgi:hypothetical protein